MGMFATNMAEVIQRSQGDVTRVPFELTSANTLELVTGANGLAWVNIDGYLALRIQHVTTISVDTSMALSTDVVKTQSALPGSPTNAA